MSERPRPIPSFAVSRQEGKRRGLRHLPAWLLVLASTTAVGMGPTTAARPAGEEDDELRRPFLIGYLESEAPSALNRDWFRRLSAYLNTHPSCEKLRREFESEGYGEASPAAAEGFADLVNRMQNKEIDCVFCPAVGFVRQIPPGKDVNETSYTVVFQVRRPTDIASPPLRNGVIVVNRQHPLYRPPAQRSRPTSPTLLARHVARDPIAFVSRYSAPGYIYPLNMLSRSDEYSMPIRHVFRGSSEEVIKLLLSGVVDIGACELSAIQEVLRRADLESSATDLLDPLKITPGSPADPIVFRRRHHPARSSLGNELRAALERFFTIDHPGRLRLEASDDLVFRNLKQAVEIFDREAVGRRGRP